MSLTRSQSARIGILRRKARQATEMSNQYAREAQAYERQISAIEAAALSRKDQAG